MKHLWAPWRMEYIKGIGEEVSTSCIFCIDDRETEDRDHLILYRGKYSIVMMNKYPYSNGHLLVFPTRHIKELCELDTEEDISLFSMLKESVSILKKTMGPEGFNIGMNLGRTAGAGIENHLHVHLVPRWNGDTNFMPIIGETKVISEHILNTYDTLIPHFKGVDKEIL